ncbi:MAG: tetratricopeptide repeat protein [Calditrichia bacterium]
MYKKVAILLLVLMSISLLFAQRYQESDDFSYALKLFNEGFYDIAAQQFNLFVNRYPNSERLPDARYYQAQALYHLGEFYNARVEFQAFAVGYPDHRWAPEAWQKVGECYVKLAKQEEAARAFETIKVLYPEHSLAPQALYQAAKIHFQMAQWTKAETVLQDLLDRYPQSAIYPLGRLLYAHLLVEKGNFDQAQKEYQKVLASDIDEAVQAQAYFGLARFYEKIAQLNKALDNYEIVLSRYSQSPLAFQSVLGKSLLLAKSGRYEEANALLNKNITYYKTTEQQARLNLALAAIYFMQSNYAAVGKVLANISPVLTNDSLKIRKLFYEGMHYFQEHKYDQCAEKLRLLVEQGDSTSSDNPYVEEARKYLGIVYLEGNNYLQGYDILLNYVKREKAGVPDSQLILKILKTVLKNNKPQIAEEFLHRILTEYPDFSQRDFLLFELGKYYFGQKDYTSSSQKFYRILNDYTCSSRYDSTRYYLSLIQTFYSPDQNLGVNKLARLLGRFLARENVDQLKLELANIYLNQLKDINAAIELCRTIIQDQPDSRLLGEAYFLLGESYRRLAELKRFQKQPYDNEQKAAQESFKSAMEYIQYVSLKDSLAFNFLRTNIGWNPEDSLINEKKIKLWSHFIKEYKGSRYARRARLVVAELYLQNSQWNKAVEQLDSLRISGDLQFAGEALYRLGILYAEKQNSSKAMEHLKNFLLDFPNHPKRAEAFAELGRLYQQNGQYQEAARLYDRLIQEYNYSEAGQRALERLPELFLAAGDFRQAVQYTKPFVQRDISGDLLIDYLRRPSHPDFYFYYGKAQFALNNAHLARKGLFDYLSLDTEAIRKDEAFYLLAEIASAEGDKESALLHLQNLSQKEDSPFFIQATAKTADIYFEQGKFNEAQLLYEKIVSRTSDPEKLILYKKQAMICLINQGKFNAIDNQISAFKKEFKNHPNLDDYLASFQFEMGKYYYRNKNFDAAIKKFEWVTKSYKKTELADDATYYLGLTYTTLNKIEKAQDILTGFSQQFPNSDLLSNVYVTLGGIYYRGEKKDLSVGAFKKAVELARNPQSKKVALTNLIKNYQDLGLWDGVLNHCWEYVKLFPDAEDVIDKKILIGAALIHLNRYSEAVEYLRSVKFEANSEQEPEVQFYIGEAYFNAGQYENAIREFVKIPLLSKQTKLQWEASALYFSGQSYEKLGRIEDAIRMYQEIIDRPGIIVDLKREAKKRIDQLKSSG